MRVKTDTNETGMINPNSKPPDPSEPPTPGDQLHQPGDKRPRPDRSQDDRQNA